MFSSLSSACSIKPYPRPVMARAGLFPKETKSSLKFSSLKNDQFQLNASLGANHQTSEENLKLQKTQSAFAEASRYQPTYRQLEALLLPVHNRQIAQLLKARYKPNEFRQLFEFCRQKGVFNITLLESGLLKTAGTTEKEDSSMGRGHWVSDTIYAKELVRDINPAIWKRNLATLATYYSSEKPAFEKIIAQPFLYHHGDGTQGVAHIFEPNTLKRFTDWQINYRLESHGLALKAFCDQLKDDALQPYQLTESMPERQAKIQAITHLAHYFQALGYPNIPSCGPWEARPYLGGATSDIEAMRSGYESLSDLLFNPSYDANPQVFMLRNQLKHQENQLSASMAQPLPSLFQRPEPLNRFLDMGRQIVSQRLLAPTGPQEVPGRDEMDAALSLVANSTIRLGATFEQDVQNHLGVFDKLSRMLVRNNGMIRYAPHTLDSQEINGSADLQPHHIPIFDDYLGPNANLAAGPMGQAVTGDRWEWAKRELLKIKPEFKRLPKGELDILANSTLGISGREAEWFLVSDLSLGYGKQVEKLLNLKETQKQPFSDQQYVLLQHSLKQEIEMLNRAYARITGYKPSGQLYLKSNGEACPPFKVPEAYQYVSTLNKFGQPGPLNIVPGMNTPLTWATASLYSASKQALNNLNRLDALGLTE